MIMSGVLYFTITEGCTNPGTNSIYLTKSNEKHSLCILNIYDDENAHLIECGPSDSLWTGYECTSNVEQVARSDATNMGYVIEISEEEFMKRFNEIYPNWQKLKFDRKTKRMYFSGEENT